MRKLLTVAFITFLSFSCTMKYNVYTSRDEFEKFTSHRMSGNVIEPEKASDLAINIHLIQFDNGNVQYLLFVQRHNITETFNIKTGESLILLVDGRRIGFSTTSDLKKSEYHGNKLAWSYAWYPTDKETLIKVANAKSVQLRLIGRDGSLNNIYDERTFSSKNLERFKLFIAEYFP